MIYDSISCTVLLLSFLVRGVIQLYYYFYDKHGKKCFSCKLFCDMLKITEVQTFITGALAHTNEYYSIVIVNS